MTRPQHPEHLAGRPGRSFYQAIGQVAAAWAQLKFTIDEAIWRLAGVDAEVGACITSHLQSANRKMQSLIALARVRSASEAKCKLRNKVFQEVDDLARKCSRIVHDS